MRETTNTWRACARVGGLAAIMLLAAAALPGLAQAQDVVTVINDKVGINEPSPASPLHVTGSGGEVGLISGGALAVKRTDGNPSNIRFATNADSFLFQNNPNNHQFSIRNETAANTPFAIFNTATSNNLVIRSGNVGIGVSNPGSPIEHSSGAFLSAGGTWTDASSRVLKQGIRELNEQEALAAFADLTPVRFSYKLDPTEERLGFIAEDVPEVVATNERKGLAPMDLVALLTKVVQHQDAETEKLRAEVAELRALVDQLSLTQD